MASQEAKKDFTELKKIVKSEIEKCPAGTELQVFHRVISPDPWALKLQCNAVRDDLRITLQAFKPERIEIFGSTVNGTAFLGLI